MRTALKLMTILFTIVLISCGGKEEKKKEKFSYEKKTETESTTAPKAEKIPASERISLIDKGIGPITSVKLAAEIDQAMVTHGEELYKSKCTACHRPTKKFIGPAPAGIMKRRSPEWIMNMILNPEEMVAENPLAKELLIEFNGSPMANQSLTEEEARAVVEYFRTL
jgi:mono/diheme cytochrome c family protein